MGQNRVDLMDELQNRRTAWLFDDFQNYTDTQQWTKTNTGAGQSLTNPDGSSGVISLGNAGSAANSSTIVASTRKNFTFASNRAIIAECQLQYTEAATSGCGIFFGFASAFSATFLADTTFIPVATGSAVGIYKQAGDTLWRAMLNVNGVQLLSGATLESSQPAPTSTFQILRVQVDMVGANIEASFFVGQRETPGADAVFPAGLIQMREAASGFGKPVKLRMSSASAAAMALGVIEKQLNAGNAETVVVDYLAVANVRT